VHYQQSDSVIPPSAERAPTAPFGGAERARGPGAPGARSDTALRHRPARDRLVEKALELAGPVRLQRAFVHLLFRAAGLVEETLTLPTGQVHVWAAAPRPNDTRRPLLLVHGFGADAEVQWAGQVWALSRRHRLVIPDLLYFGGSWPNKRSVELDDQLQMVLELMDHQRIERFDVLGISFGGFVAFELAARFDHRVGRIIISNSPGHVLSHEDHDAMLHRLGVGEVADLLVPTEASAVRDLIGIAFHRPPKVPGVALSDAFRHFFRRYADERRSVMRSLTARIEEPGLASRHVSQETLVLWGEHDRVFPAAIGRRLAAAVGKNARLHVIPGTAHSPNQEKAHEYNRVVLSFLNERRSTPPPRAWAR
jgi:pimeloyl-ACP methyl ester carboxylesterase